jgi:hypothetical protein
MKNAGWMAIAAMCVSLCVSVVAAQQKPEKPLNPAQLELTTEVAATTEEGYPSVLRITVKNAGNVAVDLPMPVVGCLPHGGNIVVHTDWKPADPNNHTGRGQGYSCGESGSPSLMERVHDKWIHLRPGEFVTSSVNLHESLGNVDPGTIEYWVEYAPPEASAKEFAELQQAGYIVPTKMIETAHQSFVVH